MANYLQNSINPPDYNWPAQLYRKIYPPGSANGSADWLDSCGLVKGSCKMELDCHDMTRRGYGHAYYIFEALKGLHQYIQAFNGMLVDSVLLSYLEIESLVKAFSLPESDQIASGIAAYISASLFIAGGAAGSSGLAMREMQKLRQDTMSESRTG